MVNGTLVQRAGLALFPLILVGMTTLLIWVVEIRSTRWTAEDHGEWVERHDELHRTNIPPPQVVNELRHLQEEIDRLTKEDKEDKREKKLKTQHLLIQVLRDMLPIIYPKRKEVDLKQDITTQSFQTLTIVTSKTHCVEFALEKAKADAEGREMKTIEIKKEDSGQVDGGSLSVSEDK